MRTDSRQKIFWITTWRTFEGMIENDCISLDVTGQLAFQLDSYSGMWQIFVVSLDDYNKLTGTERNAGERRGTCIYDEVQL